ncbi:hypothetical protein FQN54_000474 [Arachnomyces sp. PD_36]|nr:hypothetical protein FQN54_000474 [Arachnomyces sp. PD_36]
MASVSSLDKDLRNMRLSRYTPQAANEVREWIEEILNERLPSGDLLDALKDGVPLCRQVNPAPNAELINLVASPGVKFKQSSMPFVQMENIESFLRACQMPPLNLQSHDVFLTVDLYEAKDPAQVLQCLIAFSRRANSIQPGKFPRGIGTKKGAVVSPQMSGSGQGYMAPRSYRGRGASNVSETGSTTFNPVGSRTSNSGRSSPAKPSSDTPVSPASPKGGVSSWSRKTDQGTTAPAWNIHQYGYMGGASQGNQGISFGARRQITSAAPKVPSLAEKERRRREAEAEEERSRQQREEDERRRQAEIEAEEERARASEERKWQEETARLREKERREVEEEKKRWDEEQRRWEEEEERRLREEKEAEERFEKERQHKRANSDLRLNGQFLSQYQSGQGGQTQSRKTSGSEQPVESTESQRIKELERELEQAKERERRYEQERQGGSGNLRESTQGDRSRSRSRPRPVPRKPSFDENSQEQEREFLRSSWNANHSQPPAAEPTPPPQPPRPLPQPTPTLPPRNTNVPTSPRPLPDPANYVNKGPQNRTDRFLSSNPAPTQAQPTSHRPPEFSSTAEVDAENARREASTQKTRAGGWASKSLLEREMERERERQREWEENQKSTNDAVKRGAVEGGSGPGEGAWDVHQYGYLGGDSQNRGGPGLGIGGARRQIIGPRPPP